MISIILTTHNTFPYTKLAYESIRKYNPTIEIVILDDSSSDKTVDWLNSLNDDNVIKWFNPSNKPLGHTITYNIGAKLATKDYICIFHSDMICSPNFIKNLEKYLDKNSIVSGTRIEPPIYDPDNAKLIANFGMYHNEWKEKEFLSFVENKEKEYKDKTTQGFFAPWVMNRNEYIKLGGMDKLYKPYPVEDSDFINRAILAGFKIIQSRDAFCYHWVSRGHRWNGEIKKDTPEFFKYQYNSFKNFLRKWGSGPIMNSYSFPKINKKYNIGFVIEFDEEDIKDVQKQKSILANLEIIEPLCSNLYTNLSKNLINEFIDMYQKDTLFDLSKKIKNIHETPHNDILIYFKYDLFSDGYFNNNALQKGYKFLHELPDLLSEYYNEQDYGEVETTEIIHDIYKIIINKVYTYEKNLIYLEDLYYQNQLLPEYLISDLHPMPKY